MSENNLPLNEFLFQQMEGGNLPFLLNRLDYSNVTKESFLNNVVFNYIGLALIPDLSQRLMNIIPSYDKTQYLSSGTEYSEAYNVPAMKVSESTEYNSAQVENELVKLTKLYNQRFKNWNTFVEKIEGEQTFDRRHVQFYHDLNDVKCFEVPYIYAEFLPNSPNNNFSISKDKTFLDALIPEYMGLFQKYGVDINEYEAKESLKYVGGGEIKIPAGAFDSENFANNGAIFHAKLNEILREKTFDLMTQILNDKWKEENQEMPKDSKNIFDLQMYGLQGLASAFGGIPRFNSRSIKSKISVIFEINHTAEEESTELLARLKTLPAVLRSHLNKSKNKGITTEDSFNLIIFGGLKSEPELKWDNGSVFLSVHLEYLEKLKAIEPDPEKLRLLIQKTLVPENSVTQATLDPNVTNQGRNKK